MPFSCGLGFILGYVHTDIADDGFFSAYCVAVESA